MSTIMSHSPLNISEETVRDRDLIPKDRQQEMAYGESISHVTDYVAWPERSNSWCFDWAQYLENSWRCNL